MDVRKTDSLVTPFVGLVSFTLHIEKTAAFETEELAKAASTFDPSARSLYEISLRFGLQDGLWVLLDGTYKEPALSNTIFTFNEEKLRQEPNADPFAPILEWNQKKR